MKTSTLILRIVAILAVCAAVVLFFLKRDSIFGEKDPERAPITEAMVYYFDIQQLATKAAISKHIGPEQRRLLATAAAANIEDSVLALHAEAILNDFNQSGIDFTKPIYGYLHKSNNAFVHIAEVCDVDNLDKTFDVLFYLAEQEADMPLNIECFDGYRAVYFNEFTVYYNDSRLAIVVVDGADATVIAEEVMSLPLLDLSLFGDADAALYVDVNPALDFVKQKYADSDLSNLVGESDILGETTKLVTSLTFDPGRVVVDAQIIGVDNAMQEADSIVVSNRHLNYINDDALALLSARVDGVKFAEALKPMLSRDNLAAAGIALNNESNMAIAIVLDAIETIDGDFTIALESLDMELKRYVNYYWDDTSYYPEFKSVDAAVMADVTDTYIISNIAQFGAGLLQKVGSNHYALKLGDYAFNLKQDESLLFAGVNMLPEPAASPAANAKWFEDVKDRAFYFVVNVDEVEKNGAYRSYIEYEDDDKLSAIIEMLSYAYLTSGVDYNTELALVFDNADVNALEQLCDIIIPMLLEEAGDLY